MAGSGEWTDDTSMALALADSIAHAGGTSTIKLVATSAGGGKVNTRSPTAVSISAIPPPPHYRDSNEFGCPFVWRPI